MTTRPQPEQPAPPSPIVPRWEWRTFGDLGAPNDLLTSLMAVDAVESDEVYLLSVHSDASVKIRAGLMDVKVLE